MKIKLVKPSSYVIQYLSLLGITVVTFALVSLLIYMASSLFFAAVTSFAMPLIYVFLLLNWLVIFIPGAINTFLIGFWLKRQQFNAPYQAKGDSYESALVLGVGLYAVIIGVFWFVGWDFSKLYIDYMLLAIGGIVACTLFTVWLTLALASARQSPAKKTFTFMVLVVYLLVAYGFYAARKGPVYSQTVIERRQQQILIIEGNKKIRENNDSALKNARKQVPFAVLAPSSQYGYKQLLVSKDASRNYVVVVKYKVEVSGASYPIALYPASEAETIIGKAKDYCLPAPQTKATYCQTLQTLKGDTVYVIVENQKPILFAVTIGNTILYSTEIKTYGTAWQQDIIALLDSMQPVSVDKLELGDGSAGLFLN